MISMISMISRNSMISMISIRGGLGGPSSSQSRSCQARPPLRGVCLLEFSLEGGGGGGAAGGGSGEGEGRGRGEGKGRGRGRGGGGVKDLRCKVWPEVRADMGSAGVLGGMKGIKVDGWEVPPYTTSPQ